MERDDLGDERTVIYRQLLARGYALRRVTVTQAGRTTAGVAWAVKIYDRIGRTVEYAQTGVLASLTPWIAGLPPG